MALSVKLKKIELQVFKNVDFIIRNSAPELKQIVNDNLPIMELVNIHDKSFQLTAFSKAFVSFLDLRNEIHSLAKIMA